jgi:hypothetical protein
LYRYYSYFVLKCNKINAIFYDFDTNGCTEQTVPIADAGPDQIVETGTEVTLNGSSSDDPYEPDTAELFYTWEQTNPAGREEVKNLAEAFGSINCNGTCYRVNFNADTVVDGIDVAILANNMGPANLTSTDQAITQFVAGIARPHIFRLTISDGENSTSETNIVAVHHPNVAEVLTAPWVDPICLAP